MWCGVCGCVRLLYAPRAALLAAGLLLGGVLVPLLVGPAMDRLVRREAEKQSHIQAELAQTLQNMGEYLLLDAASSRAGQWQAQQAEMDRACWKLDVLESAARGLITLITFATALGVLVLAVSACRAGQLSIAEVPMLVLGVLAAFDVAAPLPLARQAAAQAKLATIRLDAACPPVCRGLWCRGQTFHTHRMIWWCVT